MKDKIRYVPLARNQVSAASHHVLGKRFGATQIEGHVSYPTSFIRPFRNNNKRGIELCQRIIGDKRKHEEEEPLAVPSLDIHNPPRADENSLR